MALLKAQKVSLVENLAKRLEDSRVALIFTYNRLNSDANLSLRDRSFEQSGQVKMISNNLLKLILAKLKWELEIPTKPLAIAFGFQDEVSAAKLLSDFAKDSGSIEILAGWIDGRFFGVSEIKALASLPNQSILRAQLVGRLGGLLRGLVYSLNFPLQKLAYVVKAVEESKKTIN